MLPQGADPNAKDTRGVTACHMAAEVGAVEVVAALVKAGADCTVMAESAAITPLIVAAAARASTTARSAISCLGSTVPTLSEKIRVFHCFTNGVASFPPALPRCMCK